MTEDTNQTSPPAETSPEPKRPQPGLDLDAARRAAGRGPNAAGPFAARKRPAYSITGDADAAD
jgi:hypothetical protein